MDNYHYLITGLPDISQAWKFTDRDLTSYIEEIWESCSRKDRELIGILTESFSDGNLNADFYNKTQKNKSVFIREYFRFDLNVRNEKVKYLNSALGRTEDTDVVSICGEEEAGERAQEEFADEQTVEIRKILQQTDILAREKAIDDLYWEKLDSLTELKYFNIDILLAFILKLHIIQRWAKLDEATGRDMFKKLVDEVRGTFKGTDFDNQGKN